MAQITTLENLESIMRRDAAFPFDAIITQVFTNTVNVKQVGSRTITRDVALPDHIKAEDVRKGMPVRLGQMNGRTTVLAIFEQFADPESFNYAGVGGRVPNKPTLQVQAMKDGWHIRWGRMNYATKYLVYANNTADGDAPELIATIPVTNPNQTNYEFVAGFSTLEAPFRYFALQVCNGVLEGDLSLWYTDVTPPANPAWVSHSFQPDGHNLRWSHSSPTEVGEYVVYRNTSASDVGAIEVLRTTKLSAIVPYAATGYWFGVQAIDYSSFNKSAIVWTGQAYDPTPTAAPTPTAGLMEFGGFVVSWPAMTNTLRYEVQSATDTNDPNTYVQEWSGQALVTPVIAKTGAGWFRVRAIGYNEAAGPWSDWVTDTIPPPQPAFDADPGDGVVILSILPEDTSHTSIGFGYYVIERADDDAGTNATVLDSHATYASFPRLVPQDTGVIKYFRLTPYDWAGNVGTATAWTVGRPSTVGGGSDDTFQDKFDNYGGSTTSPVQNLWWLKLANMEEAGWTNPSTSQPNVVDTVNFIDGNKAIKLTPDSSHARLNVSLNLLDDSRFSSDDYIVLSYYTYTTYELRLNVVFRTGTNDGFWYEIYQITPQIGWNYAYIKISDFAVDGSPSWSNITKIDIFMMPGAGGQWGDVTVDDLRLVKADPDNANTPNDTGPAWDLATSWITPNPGVWRVYHGNRSAEPSKPFTMGQVHHVTSPSLWFLNHKPLGSVDIWRGSIQAGVLHKRNGKSGLAFFIKNVNPTAWTMYAIEADNVNDSITLVKWVNGMRTILGAGLVPGFISGSTQILWIGADFSDYDSDGGRIKVYASFTEGNLIQAANLKISIQDTEVGSGGTVGLLSNQTNVRFVNFVAGSPAHAQVADVSLGLDGPIIAGETRRIHYSRDNNRFEYTDDGAAFLAVGGDMNKATYDPNGDGLIDNADKVDGYHAGNASNQVPISNGTVNTNLNADQTDGFNAAIANTASTLAARDSAGDITARLFRPEYTGSAPSFNYINVQNAVGAGADNYMRAATMAEFKARMNIYGRGCWVYRSGDYTGTRGAWTPVYFNAQQVSQQAGGPYWDGSTAIYVARTGWHLVTVTIGVYPNDWPVFYLTVGINSGVNAVYGGHLVNHSSNADQVLTHTKAYYVNAGNYFQAYYLKSSGSGNPIIRSGWTTMTVVELPTP